MENINNLSSEYVESIEDENIKILLDVLSVLEQEKTSSNVNENAINSKEILN